MDFTIFDGIHATKQQIRTPISVVSIYKQEQGRITSLPLSAYIKEEFLIIVGMAGSALRNYELV